MNNNLLKNLFSSGIQAIATQILGSIFFYIVSLYLTKYDFGIINWANAVSIFITTILSFGLEQVIIRRIATSERSDWTAVAYLLHTFAGSIIMFLILLFINKYVGQSNAFHFLPWLFAAQAILYIGSPLKAFLNAKENFTPYGVIALISNLAKIILVFVFLSSKKLSIEAAIEILIICSLFELVALSVYIKSATNLKIKFKLTAYLKLLKESFPQYISVIFDSSLSRMDWILLGILATKEITADYSFAYRAYEITRLPLMVIAPVILPRFSRLLASSILNTEKQKKINQFFSIEIFFAIAIPLILNILWSPLISAITHYKYGASNAVQFLILSLCIPFQFTINLLWTLSFANKKYKPIQNITILTAITNIVLNVILIPLYGGTGAAIAYLFSTIIQICSYYMLVRKTIMLLDVRSFFVLIVIALGVYFFSIKTTNKVILQIIIAVTSYISLAILFKLIKKENLKVLKQYLTK